MPNLTPEQKRALLAEARRLYVLGRIYIKQHHPEWTMLAWSGTRAWERSPYIRMAEEGIAARAELERERSAGDGV